MTLWYNKLTSMDNCYFFIGVSHLDDLGYVLDSYLDPTTTAEDLRMQKVLIDLWVSFATDG